MQIFGLIIILSLIVILGIVGAIALLEVIYRLFYSKKSKKYKWTKKDSKWYRDDYFEGEI